MTQFEKAIQSSITCDICGEIMHPMYGCGWDNDRIVCASRGCCAEIMFPTSTEVNEDIKVWLLEVDDNPQPWEDNFYPERVFVGTSTQAHAELEKLKADNPQMLWVITEVHQNRIFYGNPNLG